MTSKTLMNYFYSFIILHIIVLLPSVGYSQKSVGSSDSGAHSGFNNLLPVPQQVSFSEQLFFLNDSWFIDFTTNIQEDDPALRSLISELNDRFNIKIRLQETAKKNNSRQIIRMTVKEGSVLIGKATDKNRAALQKQAYRLKLNSAEIAITANAPNGLFYGVQTLLQLVKSEKGQAFLPEGEIVDWPDIDLRMIYWDDAHHLERFDAMKRAIRQASYYKINAFALKLEGHFQFENAKPIVEPYAYTPAEYQELTDYAKAHYVELVPYLDAPAHISFILKHPEYADLRTFPNSNYEFSVTNPKSDELLLGMFDNLMEANKGGKYILFSTDEAYYVGKSESEKKRSEELGGDGIMYAEYITRIGNKLHEKGRTVIIWTEYPLTPSDIRLLPSHLVNGVYAARFYARNSDDIWTPKFKEHGMRQLIYNATQGVEPLFPNYYKLPEKNPLTGNTSLNLTDNELKQSDISKGNVGDVLEGISSSIAAGRSDFMGVVVAAWGDSGLNPETFWLGYAACSAAGWNSKSMTSKDLTNRFFNSFYGNKTVSMENVYRLLSTQAEFYDKSWEWSSSQNRTPIFGRSIKIFGNDKGAFEEPITAQDQTLPALPVPSATDLSLNTDWNSKNKERLLAAEEFLMENNELMNLLQENLIRVDYQHYNLQVLRSVAQLCRQNLNMLLDLQRVNDFLNLSYSIASTNPAVAVSLIDQALDQVKKIRDERNEVLQTVTTVWYQDWYPRVAEANGRKYLDQVDDVKDHLPVRTVDMSYLIYRQLKYPLGKWAEEVADARNQFAKRNNLPASTETFKWETTEN